MKKIKWVSYLLMILIGISSSCYALSIAPPSILERIINFIAGFGTIILLLILYGILIKNMISKNKEKQRKTKKVKVRNSVFLLITIIVLAVNIWKINQEISFHTIVRYGYTDAENNILIEPKFEYAEEFYNGYAKIGVEGFSGMSYLSKYGFINRAGEVIVEPIYHALSYFNEVGHAYGKIYDYGECKYYKIYQNGNVELITLEEYSENENIEPVEEDNNIRLKEKKMYNDVEHLLYVILIRLIVVGLLLFGIIKIIKKKDLQINGGYDGKSVKKENKKTIHK